VSTAGYYCKDLTPEDGSLVVHRPRVRPTWLSWRRDRRGLLRCDPEDMPAGGEE